MKREKKIEGGGKKNERGGKILQAKEGCEKGRVRSQCIPARSISRCSVVEFLSGMLGDVTQGAVPVHTIFPQLLKGPQAGSIPGAVVLSCRESPVISEVGVFLQIHLTRRFIQCERAQKGATGEVVDQEDSITDHISIEHISVLHCWCLINIIFQECRFCSA